MTTNYGNNDKRFQHTAARRRLVGFDIKAMPDGTVSTHSRPKAAGRFVKLAPAWVFGFNTQPPEGGWFGLIISSAIYQMFQHTAARRRLDGNSLSIECPCRVSTHSRPKAAGSTVTLRHFKHELFQHTAARRRLDFGVFVKHGVMFVSTHSRPKAAGFRRQ